MPPVDKLCQTILEAGNNGVKLVVFPEAIIPRYPYWALVLDPVSSQKRFNRALFDQSVDIPSPSTDALCEAARQAKCFVKIGLNERAGGTLYN